MSRIIIENRSKLPDWAALAYVRRVIEKGRISGDGDKAQYCYSTLFTLNSQDMEITVSAFLNKKSDRFVVHHNDGVNHNER